jgi:hypothetical protein
MGHKSKTDFDHLRDICLSDADNLEKKAEEYGDSWRQRGGVGAFMMLARKWDRIENTVKEYNWDIFEALAKDPNGIAGVFDDIGDLRRYLLLVEEACTSKHGLILSRVKAAREVVSASLDIKGTPGEMEVGEPDSRYTNQD